MAYTAVNARTHPKRTKVSGQPVVDTPRIRLNFCKNRASNIGLGLLICLIWVRVDSYVIWMTFGPSGALLFPALKLRLMCDRATSLRRLRGLTIRPINETYPVVAWLAS